MDDSVLFGSRAYLVCFHLLLFARGMDLLSTWLATPNLRLEANPIARKLGWKWGLPFNLALCGYFAAWPLPAVIISTTSALVAARNFQGVWLMRTMGEEVYRHWMVQRMGEARPVVYLGCLFAQVALFALVGSALALASSDPSGRDWIQFGIGVGIIGYALAVLIFTLISMWRLRRNSRSIPPD